MLNIVMVNAWNYLGLGQEYVDKLKRGVTRNLSVPHTFHVITEDEVPSWVEGWWSKLAMFRPGRFNGPCLFFDLDTVITGSLDDVAAYRGDIAMLTDFYRPDDAASGVMAWNPEKTGHIWNMWTGSGMPQFHPLGDGGWIGSLASNADRLQDVFPGQFVSFKAHCQKGIPEGARVVSFHGLPRPHHMRDLMKYW